LVKKILVPLDGSKLAEKALPYAANLARKYGAELILARSLQPMLVVSEYVKMAFYGPRIFQDKDEARAYLSRVQSKFRELNLPTRITVLVGLPIAESIVDIASQESIDMIVMGTHDRSLFSRWIFGSVTYKVLRYAPCPVFFVRATKAQYQPNFWLKRLLSGWQSDAEKAEDKNCLNATRQNGDKATHAPARRVNYSDRNGRQGCDN
jgi:nucleotide-binding universal stress UspA family protein